MPAMGWGLGWLWSWGAWLSLPSPVYATLYCGSSASEKLPLSYKPISYGVFNFIYFTHVIGLIKISVYGTIEP